MIGVDWGTTSFRAFRLGADGTVLDRREGPHGIMAVDGRFAEVLARETGDWLAAGETEVIMSGMIGSRQGWVEAPYVKPPAGIAELAAAAVPVPFAGATVRLIPGIAARDATDVPDVMRGEETQIAGIIDTLGSGPATVCLPGTHSKWVQVEGGAIRGFETHMTGEVFAALRGHTILGRAIRPGPTVPAAFARGVARAAERGGLLHHLFGVRALGLTGELAEAESSSYLSGLLIGHEIKAALADAAAPIHLVGTPTLCTLYAQGLAALGIGSRTHPPDVAARGLARLAGTFA